MKKTVILAVAVATICIGSQAWAADVRVADGAMRQDSPENIQGGSGAKPQKFIIAHYYNSSWKRHYSNSSSPYPSAIQGKVASKEAFPIAHYYNSSYKRHYSNSSSPRPSAIGSKTVASKEAFPIAHYYNSAYKRHYSNSSSPSPIATKAGAEATR